MQIVEGESGKQCSMCNGIFSYDKFQKGTTNKDGYGSWCIACRLTRDRNLNNPPREDGEKLCCICKEIVPRTNYYPDRRHVDGRANSCKKCLLKKSKVKRNAARRTDGLRTCKRCHKDYSETQFNGKIGYVCRSCREIKIEDVKKLRKTYPIKIDGTKICGDCKRELSIRKFYKNKYMKDGRNSNCMTCKKTTTPINYYPSQMNGTKICNNCKKELPIIDFGKNQRHKDGRVNICKPCKQEQLRTLRTINKTRMVNLMGGKCERCSESNIYCLTFHHIDSTTKESDLSHILSGQISKKRWKQACLEALKCELLCFNCHMKVHYDQKIGEFLES